MLATLNQLENQQTVLMMELEQINEAISMDQYGFRERENGISEALRDCMILEKECESLMKNDRNVSIENPNNEQLYNIYENLNTFERETQNLLFMT